MHGGGWWSFISFDESKGKPKVDRQLIRRVWAYARPYWVGILILLVLIILQALIELIPPLLYRALIDDVLPNGDIRRLNLLALAMVAIPITSGLLGVVERFFGARVGEGVIFDLRQQMYDLFRESVANVIFVNVSGHVDERQNGHAADTGRAGITEQ